MHDNVIIGLVILTAFTLSIMLALYGMRLLDRERQWRPRRYGISAREVPCSFCGKLVRAEAVICRHCHHGLDENAEERPDAEALNADAARVGQSPQQSNKLLAGAGATSFVIESEEFSKNQALAWLDTAFQQLTVKAASTAWTPTISEHGVAEEPPVLERDAVDAAPPRDPASEPARRNEVAVRTIGPFSQQAGLNTQEAKNWFRAWRPRKEWAVAAGIASVAVIVGGSTFLAGSKSRIEKPNDYTTFDVSERAPLYTGPETRGETKARAETVSAVGKAGSAPVEPANEVKPEATAKAEPVVEAARTPVPAVAVPEMRLAPEKVSSPAAEKLGENPVNLAAVPPSDPAAAPVQEVRQEDWASSVARAIKPARSKDLVVVVQRLIRAEGYDPGTIDGLVGPRTRRAIQQYQRNGGLTPTGEIDRDLLTKLNLADRTVRVIGPMSGVAEAAVKPPARSGRPVVQWTK